MELKLPTKWLIEAWGGKKKQELPPVMTIDGALVKVVLFPRGGAGMRVMTRATSVTGSCTFKVSEAMRGFVRILADWHHVTLTIRDTTMSVTVQNCCSALQYNFPKIELTDDKIISDHPKDICTVVPCTQWLTMWKSMPYKGVVTIAIDKTKRSVTMKHSGGRWAGAIQARDKPTGTVVFECDCGIARHMFAYIEPKSAFSNLIFMDCGVLRWTDDNVTIYLAPFVPS